MKGMKALEYRIWARSFNKIKNKSFDPRSFIFQITEGKKNGNTKFEYLTKIREQMRNIRSIRLDKNFIILS